MTGPKACLHSFSSPFGPERVSSKVRNDENLAGLICYLPTPYSLSDLRLISRLIGALPRYTLNYIPVNSTCFTCDLLTADLLRGGLHPPATIDKQKLAWLSTSGNPGQHGIHASSNRSNPSQRELRNQPCQLEVIGPDTRVLSYTRASPSVRQTQSILAAGARGRTRLPSTDRSVQQHCCSWARAAV